MGNAIKIVIFDGKFLVCLIAKIGLRDWVIYEYLQYKKCVKA